MQLEPNLFFEKKDEQIDAYGVHDEIGKCFYLLGGSQGNLCSNHKRIFLGQPEFQKKYEIEILPPERRSSAGDDTHYYLQKNIRCYPADGMDELTVAASLIAGRAMKGNNVWKDEDGVSVKKQQASKVDFDKVDENDANIQRYESVTQMTFDIIAAKKPLLILTLSYAYHLNDALGNKNEDRFVVPRQVDHCMVDFGFLCEEAKSYDLVIRDTDFTISDKMSHHLFHQTVSKKPRADTIKGNLLMSNIRSGQSSDNIQRPQFDCLLAMQYIPFLVCGVAPYSKIVKYFRIKDGGTILDKVPVDYFKYVISPTEKIIARDISPQAHNELEKFAYLVKGAFLPELMQRFSVLDNDAKIDDNTHKDPW